MPFVNRKYKFILALLVGTFLIFGPDGLIDAFSGDKDTTNQGTIPTRTPTAAPSTPKPGGPSATPNQSPTAEIENTPTPTLQLVLTPEGGFYPTAVPCTEPPTIQALDTVNLRDGPGTEHELTGQLVFLEVRPIVGRSSQINWWLIELSDGSESWVNDKVVLVSGYIGNVPEVDPDPHPEATLPANSTWEPTIEPSCTPLPTYTPTPPPVETTSTVPSEIPTEVEAEISTSVPDAEASSAPSSGQTATPTAQSAEPSGLETTEISPTNSVVQDSSEEEDAASDDETFDANILLIAGLGLILVGVILYVGRRFVS